MLNVLLYVVILIQTAQAENKPTPPVPVSYQEAREHRIDSEPLYVRVPDSGGMFNSIDVVVTVDRTGAVTSAHAEQTGNGRDFKASPAFLAQAESMVHSLKYSPFIRGGHSVAATFTQYVSILPPERNPVKHVPFPRVKDWNSVEISLSRTACFGTCPSYAIEISGDGSVIYNGRGYVTFTGRHLGFADPRNVIALVKEFEKADFYSLDDQYRTRVTDNPTQTISISIDGRRKQVVDYVGLESGMPLAVSNLEDEIDRVAGSDRWTKGNSESVAALEAEHWNFKSPEAAAALSRAAREGDAAVVRDLARAGATLNGDLQSSTRHGDRAAEFPALLVAAHRGNVEMLQVLLDAGAGSAASTLADAVVAAAGSGNVDAYRLLLRYGAPATPRDSGGTTALMAAARSGFPAMVRDLLKSHADLNAIRIVPPANCRNELECLAQGEGRTALMEAVAASDYDVPPEGVDRVEVVRLLLAAGADVNARDKKGNTALILSRGNAAEADLLLQAGADPNARNFEGKTALETTYDDDVKRVLHKHGAVDVKATDEKQ